MSEDLPPGWTRVRLRDVAQFNPKHAPAIDDATLVSFVPMAAASETSPDLDTSQARRLGEVRKGYTHFADDDVLFAKITPCMENGKGGVAQRLSNGLGCGTTEFVVMRPSPALNSFFLYRFLAQPAFRREAKENFTGTAGQARVPTPFLEDAVLPLPPQAEQRRIVARLEALLSKVDACQQRLAKIPTILKRFRQSVLAAACSGRLTADWRDKHCILDQWADVALEHICDVITDGDHQPPPKQSSGIPFLTIGNISCGFLDFSATRFVSKDYFLRIKSDRKPRCGDLLYTVVGASIGIPVVVPDNRQFCFQRHIALLRPSKLTTTGFLHVLMQSPTVFRESWNRVTGSAQPTLPLGALRTISVRCPPLREQHEIVHRVEALFAFADTIEARFAKAQAQVDKLTASLLAKAFRGELVPQDPNDEPASALLDRIRAERAGSSGANSAKSEKAIQRRRAVASCRHGVKTRSADATLRPIAAT